LAQQKAQPDRAVQLKHLDALLADRPPNAADLAADRDAVANEIDRWTLRPGQLLIVDEAGMAGTFALRDLANQAAQAGAKLLLVGDPCQLSAIETGGAFGLLANSRPDTATLTKVRRFIDPDGTTRTWEQHATLALRRGDVSIFDTYQRHGRITAGDAESLLENAYQAWRSDTTNGRLSVLIARDHATVVQLNRRAQHDLIADGTVDDTHVTALADGSRVGRGDTIVTREIDRYLADGTNHGGAGRHGRHPDGYVRNGQRWSVEHVNLDGSLTVRLNEQGQTSPASVVLPAQYVNHHVELGYATTTHRAQGMTTDSAHVIADTATTREGFYVAMTRGRLANHAYLHLEAHADSAGGDPHLGAATDPMTAAEVFTTILNRVSAAQSAHDAIRTEQHKAVTLAQLAAEVETITAYATETTAAEMLLAAWGDSPEAAEVIAAPEFPRIARTILFAHLRGEETSELLTRCRPSSDNPRTPTELITQARAAGIAHKPGKTPRMVAELVPDATQWVQDPQILTALRDRYDLMEQRLATMCQEASKNLPEWASPEMNPRLLRRIIAYRDRWNIATDATLGAPPTANDPGSKHRQYRNLRHEVTRSKVASIPNFETHPASKKLRTL
jgi:hypothetical protein